MKLTFVGADHQVTGSCHFLQACGKNMLVDCGMQQGSNPFECCEMPVDEAQIDYVFLTHAHVDHSAFRDSARGAGVHHGGRGRGHQEYRPVRV